MAEPYTITINTAGTASTSTVTITWSRGSNTTAGTEPDPEPEPKEFDLAACFEGMSLPQPMPPRMFGTCGRCQVNLAMDACGGRCSVCGGPLRVG